MKTILKCVVFLVFIGVLGMAINTIFGYETITYLQKQRITMFSGDHFYIWRYNFWPYIQNIQLAITNLSQLELELPTRNWSNIDIANNVLLVVDYIIVVVNILMYPLRIGGYLLNNVLAIFGINSTPSEHNGLFWLNQFVTTIIEIQIPYI